MASAAMMEEQMAREAAWVSAGVERFRQHCARQDPSGNPGGRALLRSVLGRAEAEFERHAAEARKGAHAAKNRVLAVIDLLGSRHLAAISATSAVNTAICPRKYKEGIRGSILEQATALGLAVEHDVRMRAWSQDGHKALVQKMRRDIEGNPRSLRRRLTQLQTLATEAWSKEDSAVTGMDLLFLVAAAAPDVFVTPVVRYAGKTVRVLKITDEAMTQIEQVEEMASVNSPKWSMMLVPPRRWEYGDPP